ncbi:hypothetical protein HBI24_072900 [Parastagonospora nodorum]|nr:hypothetical protein HBI33_229760 [Parastagonospora nodorum]KAH5586999.1 hypothetical protein HBI24_072900 [Parastagonospora nodorum]KAH5699957.1 hypothetical protein HBI20_256840 [Parastagonospora nodorum]KAH5708713.1 hypothetical protein HBI18_237400 [Parastagonospora nodorum]KAH5754482.1 hypothetical protein HBI17_077220 [Parastagonospora nodorum]
MPHTAESSAGRTRRKPAEWRWERSLRVVEREQMRRARLRREWWREQDIGRYRGGDAVAGGATIGGNEIAGNEVEDA